MFLLPPLVCSTRITKSLSCCPSPYAHHLTYLLNPNNWQQIDRLHNVLHAVELTTRITEGNRTHLFKWYSTLQFTPDYTSKFSAEVKEETRIDNRFLSLSACCNQA
jgi:hypothetical protein